MRVEHMEDMAKLYAPAAARAIRNKDWDQAAALLLERCQKLDMALQSLTPGGSEYVGDPDRCVATAKAVRENYRRMWREAVEMRDACIAGAKKLDEQPQQ